VKWIKQIKSFFSSRKNTAPEYIWCLVGNAIDEHEYGEKKEIRRGTKNFRPGAKLYCFPPLWGDGYEKIKVIGVPRKKKKKIIVILDSKLVVNWRKQKVYDEFIITNMVEMGGWNYSIDSQKRLDSFLKSLNKNKS